MSNIVTTPSVFINKSGNIAIAHRATSSTVFAVTFEGDAKYRIIDFLKDYKPVTQNDGTNYPVGKAAHKMLYNKFQTPSNGAIQILKEIITMSSQIITVTKTAEFIGRFPDALTAAECSPADSIIICTAADLDCKSFTKAQLIEALKPTDLKNPDDIKKTGLANMLFEKYSGTAITVAEPTKKVRAVKAKADAKPRERSKKDMLRDLLNARRIMSEEDILKEIYEGTETTEFTVRTAINNLKTEKHAGKEGVLDIITGKVDGIRVYCLATTVVEFDAKASDVKAAEKETKAAERAAKKAEREANKVVKSKKSTKASVPVDENNEIDNSDQQPSLPL